MRSFRTFNNNNNNRITNQPSICAASKKNWTKEEDEALRLCIQEHGIEVWSNIADRLQSGRSGKQCRERWHNHLDCGIIKGSWTNEEDCIIFSLQKLLGNQWANITSYLPGRTDNAVKNRFHALSRITKSGKSITLVSNPDAINELIKSNQEKYDLNYGHVTNMEVIQEKTADSLFLHIPYDPSYNPFTNEQMDDNNKNNGNNTFPFTWDSFASIGNDGINFEFIEAKCSEFVDEHTDFDGCDYIFKCCSFDPNDTNTYNELNKMEEVKNSIKKKSKISCSSGTFFSNLNFFGIKKEKQKPIENLPVKIKRTNFFDIQEPSDCLGDDVIIDYTSAQQEQQEVDDYIMSVFDE